MNKKHLITKFEEGIMYGLGMIVAFAIVAPLLVWLLSFLNWVPLVSDFVVQVTETVQQTSPVR